MAQVMIQIIFNGKVVKTVATLQEAEEWKSKHFFETNVIGKFSTETSDPDYNEYRQAMQDYLYK